MRLAAQILNKALEAPRDVRMVSFTGGFATGQAISCLPILQSIVTTPHRVFWRISRQIALRQKGQREAYGFRSPGDLPLPPERPKGCSFRPRCSWNLSLYLFLAV